jgi:CBS domain-containing protein
MQVREAMTTAVHIANPNQTIREIAQLMGDLDVGAMPVGEDDRLVGMITDRDIAVRAVALGRAPDTKVRDVMSQEVRYCFDDDEVERVARNMADIQVRRLPVVNREKRLVGIVSLADVATKEGPMPAGKAVQGISQPGGRHNQANA